MGLDNLNLAVQMLNSAVNAVLDISVTPVLSLGSLILIGICVGYIINVMANKEA